MPILAKMLVPYRKTKIHHFNMVHPRDISLTESWGSSVFEYIRWCQILILGTFFQNLLTEAHFEQIFQPRGEV